MAEKSFLLDLFYEIRTNESWVLPGMEEYFMVCSLIQSGDFPISSFQDIAFILETCWLKSQQHKSKFTEIVESRRLAILDFAQYIASMNTHDVKLDTPATPSGVENSVDAGKANTENNKEENKKSQGNFEHEKNERSMGSFEQEAENEEVFKRALRTDRNDEALGTLLSFSIPNALLKRQDEIDGYNPVQDVYHTPFVITDDYFPVKSRQLQQLWRTLKNKIEANNSTHIDFKRTISRTAQKGYFVGFSFERYLQNRFSLFMLIDNDSAMIGVSDFGSALVSSVKESGIHENFKPWYFSQVPVFDKGISDYLFFNEISTKQISLRRLFSGLMSKNILVVIYSEAGAFLGRKDAKQMEQMTGFLTLLKRQVGQVVWLNPAPKRRWNAAAAGDYAMQVSMFDTSKKDLQRSALSLRGKLIK